MTIRVPLPGPLIEAGNGMMLVLFAAMLISALGYFIRQVREVHETHPFTSRINLLKIVYQRSKASWSASLLFLGLFVRTGDVWLVRHIQNHGGQASPLEPWASLVLIASTVPIVWGAICWMRAVMPLRCWSGAWAVVGGVAVIFGVFMAM